LLIEGSRQNAEILRYALNDNIAMATSLSGLGNDGRRKRLKLRPQSFKPPLPKAAHFARSFIGCLCCLSKSFDDFIRHQFQALTFAFFCQEKEDSPSAASRAKPAQRENIFGR